MTNYFTDLFGNENIKTELAVELKNKIYNHAYILEGYKKSGKHTLAFDIAKSLTCQNKNDTNFPCNKCANCKKINEKISTDVLFFDAEDITKEQTETFRRDILETLKYYPNDSEFKFYIVENAQFLNEHTQNLLLKSIEEPPEYVVWFLLVDNVKNLLQTVKSRCRTLKLEQFTTRDLIEILNENFDSKTDDELYIAALNSYGSYGIAKKILTRGLDEEEITNSFLLTKSLLEGTKYEVSEYLGKFEGKKEKLLEIISGALLYLRDIISLKFKGTIIYYKSIEEIQSIANTTSIKKLYLTYNTLKQSLTDIEKNINLNLVMANISSIAK